MSRRSKPRKCIHCKRIDDTEFHEIFDEVGIELQLDLLVEQYFKVQVTASRNEQPLLCDECVNELIELYDNAEKQKELENSATNENDEKIVAKLQVAVETSSEEVTKIEIGDEQTTNDIDETTIGFNIEATSVYDEEFTSDSGNKEESVFHGEAAFIVEQRAAFHVKKETTSDVDVDAASDYNVETVSEYNDEPALTVSDALDAETFELVDWNDDETVDSNSHDDGETMEEAKGGSLEQWATVVENKDDEIDDTVLQMYADATINTNLEELQLDRESVCNICSETLTQHQDLLLHIREHHQGENDFLLPCILDNCQQMYEDERLLARHIVLKHYDLRGITIFGSCPDCGMPFSNFLVFNKHSCCRKLKFEKNSIYCEECKLQFPTFRRYRFHKQFHMKNSRPKVCLLCDRFFSDGEEFFEHVHYDHEPPNEMMCTKCDRIYNNKKLFDSHMASHNLALKFQCNLCPKAYLRNQWLKVHMQTHDEPMCEICNKTFTTKNSYRNHIKLHQSEADVQTCICFCTMCGQIGREREDLQPHVEDKNTKCFNAAIQEDLVNVVYFCEYCESVFKEKEDLKQHRATGVHEDKLFHCQACTATFDELRKVRAHFKSHKDYVDWRISLPLYRLYMCDVGDCEQSYAMWLSLHSHKAMKHKELRLICAACDTRFANKEDFEVHSTKCLKDGKYVCQFCGKECPTKMSRSVHMARSHNNKNFRCDSCKASFKDESSLTKHVDLMHVVIECPICLKKVKNKRNFLLHNRVKHENAKRYFCDTCNKGFYHKSDMEAHERTAHSAISYVCEKCPFTTNYQNSLEVHIARHNNDLQFECPICSRKFARKRVMELHVKRHEVEREFICSQYSNYDCSASFITRNLLNRHIKEKHEGGGAPPKKRRRKQTQTQEFETNENLSDHDDPTESFIKNEESTEYVSLICYENEDKEFLNVIDNGYEVTEVLVTDYSEDIDVMKLE